MPTPHRQPMNAHTRYLVCGCAALFVARYSVPLRALTAADARAHGRAAVASVARGGPASSARSDGPHQS